MEHSERPGNQEAIKWVKQDLTDNVRFTLRAAEGLVALLDLGPPGQQALQKARLALIELLTALGLEDSAKAIPQKFTGFGISYAGMAPREAAILDLAVFGENRPMSEVQENVFSLDFEKEREGQIRSSINARGNLGVYFKVAGEKEIVTLTPKGRELAAILKRQRGL